MLLLECRYLGGWWHFLSTQKREGLLLQAFGGPAIHISTLCIVSSHARWYMALASQGSWSMGTQHAKPASHADQMAVTGQQWAWQALGQEASFHGSPCWCVSGTIVSGQVGKHRQPPVPATTVMVQTLSTAAVTILSRTRAAWLHNSLEGCSGQEDLFLDPPGAPCQCLCQFQELVVLHRRSFLKSAEQFLWSVLSALISSKPALNGSSLVYGYQRHLLIFDLGSPTCIFTYGISSEWDCLFMALGQCQPWSLSSSLVLGWILRSEESRNDLETVSKNDN